MSYAPPPPGGGILLCDLQPAIEKVLRGPGRRLGEHPRTGRPHGPDGNVKSRMILAPPSEMQGRLLEMLRDYLAVPAPERTAGGPLKPELIRPIRDMNASSGIDHLIALSGLVG